MAKAVEPAVPVPVTKVESTAVVDYMAELQAMTIATQEAERPKSNWASFKGGQLTINDQVMKDNKAPVVVIHSVFENQLYKDRYDPNNIQPPICYAFGETDDDLKPHPDSAEPQHPTCEGCPKNEWKSDPGGGKGKACKNVRRLALMSASDLVDVEKIRAAEVVMAKLPVTSVKNWSTYASQIANVLKVPPIAVITEISVVPDAKTQFQVNFALLDKITDGAVIQQLLARRKDTHPLMFQPYDKPSAPAEPAQNRKY
jgi:hypothetical protein